MVREKNASILFVCMGNICRSPMVETVARVELARAGIAADVASAGTEGYHIREGADSRAIEMAEAHGYPLAQHRARQVRASDFDDFDLVLAMDRVNLRALQRHRPRADAREAELFLEHVGFDGLDEVPDPYYGGTRDFAHVLDLARRGSALLIARLSASRSKARA
jgi:protein-tyrosine phosphatase